MTHQPPLSDLFRTHVHRLQHGYADALAACGFDAAVVHAGAARPRSPFDDQDWPFHPTPAFAHWLPLCEPDAAVIVRPGQAPVLVRSAETSFWEGRPPDVDDMFVDPFELTEVAAGEIPAALPTAGRIALVSDTPQQLTGRRGDLVANPPALLAELDRVRAVKSDYERACIATANARAAAGHVRVAAAFAAADRSELELHLLYLEATAQDDSDTPYKNIFALGRNAATLHHVHYGRRPPPGGAQSLLVDAGATCRGYASDVTRTLVKGDGPGTGEFRALVARVEALQQEICDSVRPGLAFEALHDRAHALLALALHDLGVSRAGPDALVESGATRAFLPHGLGHSLGIQVHDVGLRTRPPREDNPFLRNTSDIAPGQVFTIEPGCYFIDSLLADLRTRPIAADLDWERIDRLAPFGGVRIEDNIAVMADGTRNLTRDSWPASP